VRGDESPCFRTVWLFLRFEREASNVIFATVRYTINDSNIRIGNGLKHTARLETIVSNNDLNNYEKEKDGEAIAMLKYLDCFRGIGRLDRGMIGIQFFDIDW
jgi:hypothetical protein